MTRFVSSIAVTALLSACAGTSTSPAPSQTGGSFDRVPGAGANEVSSRPPQAFPESESAAPAAAPRAAMRDNRAAPPAPPAARGASEGAADKALQREDEARPGLGTTFGETRGSRVSSSAFERGSDRPFAVSTLFYNDADGVRAMTRGASYGMAPADGVEVANGALRVRLLDASGMPLPTYDVASRNFVVGQDGARYVIQLQNRSDQRFEAVATVDGLDVIDGRPGSFEKRGYLIGPYQTVEIDGFRRNFDEVAAFRFGSVQSSYAARKGDDRNVGVLGVAFFSERNAEPVWMDREIQRRRGADAFPGRFATPPNAWE
jgi:hypothetical protein